MMFLEIVVRIDMRLMNSVSMIKDPPTQDAFISSRASGDTTFHLLIPKLFPTPMRQTTSTTASTIVRPSLPRLRACSRARSHKQHYLDPIPTATSLATQERDPHTSTHGGNLSGLRNSGSTPPSAKAINLKPMTKKNSTSPLRLSGLPWYHSFSIP